MKEQEFRVIGPPKVSLWLKAAFEIWKGYGSFKITNHPNAMVVHYCNKFRTFPFSSADCAWGGLGLDGTKGIWINDYDFSWGIYPNQDVIQYHGWLKGLFYKTQIDAAPILAHEIGHSVFGLQHTTEPNNIMCTVTKVRVLGSYDKEKANG